MDIFEENKSCFCSCGNAILEGIFNNSFSNKSFATYGMITNGRKFLVKYYGKLCDSNNHLYIERENLKEIDKNNTSAPNIKKIYIYYCYNNNWKEKKIVTMNICSDTSFNNQAYCTIIEVPKDDNLTMLNIAFADDNGNWDTDMSSTYMLNVYPDIEKKIMKRYNLDATPPTIVESPTKIACLLKKVKLQFLKNFIYIFKKDAS